MAGPHRPRRLRRTWPQRLVLTFNTLLVVGCLLAAFLVWYGNDRLGDLERVSIVHSQRPAPSLVPSDAAGPTPTDVDIDERAGDRPQNFLLVGSDSRDCIDPTSPDAAGFIGDDPIDGQRSDTIMVLRVDAQASAAAILSFPRDLWVDIAGTERRSRINSAFDRDNPSRLVQTIEENFDVPIDHYVEIDFCAFRSIVDAVGGVKVPFVYPARDRYTGLNITAPGCVQLDGRTALAYTRSRHYQYFDGERWRDDPTSDFGRIARQQDFIRRTVQRAIDRGARRPTVAKSLLDAALDNVRVDQELTISEMLGLATRLRDFDPAAVRTYRIDGRPTVIGGAQVILPDTESRAAKQLLAAFRGEVPIAEIAAAQTTSGATTTEAPATSPTTAGDPTDARTGPTATTDADRTSAGTAASTVPTSPVTTTDLINGVSPPNDPTCR